jgi:hypothetical protein
MRIPAATTGLALPYFMIVASFGSHKALSGHDRGQFRSIFSRNCPAIMVLGAPGAGQLHDRGQVGVHSDRFWPRS